MNKNDNSVSSHLMTQQAGVDVDELRKKLKQTNSRAQSHEPRSPVDDS